MSRLHVLRTGIGAVAEAFAADVAAGVAVPDETTEGLIGPVLFEANGRRLLRLMRWGFPRPGRAGNGHGADIIGLVADLTNPMWEQTVVDPRYRCIIPITHFGNPDGEPGAKTRTWFSVDGQPVMAWAGFCRKVPGVGPCYAGMTMEANAAIPPTNDRMPVLLGRTEHDAWLHGSIQDVIRFQFRPPIAAERMIVQRTDDAWRSGAPPPSATQMPLL